MGAFSCKGIFLWSLDAIISSHLCCISSLSLSLFLGGFLEDILTSNCFFTDQCHKCCYWGCMPYFKRGRNRQEPKGNVDFVQASGHWFLPSLDILLVSSYGLIHTKSALPKTAQQSEDYYTTLPLAHFFTTISLLNSKHKTIKLLCKLSITTFIKFCKCLVKM